MSEAFVYINRQKQTKKLYDQSLETENNSLKKENTVLKNEEKRLLDTLQEKNDLAQEFRNHCFADEGEIRKIFHDSSLEGKSHEESWDFILASKHSLERHTNLGLLESS